MRVVVHLLTGDGRVELTNSVYPTPAELELLRKYRAAGQSFEVQIVGSAPAQPVTVKYLLVGSWQAAWNWRRKNLTVNPRETLHIHDSRQLMGWGKLSLPEVVYLHDANDLPGILEIRERIAIIRSQPEVIF